MIKSSRITYLQIEKYRSISEKIKISFPSNQPLVLVGENNSGKSNIIRALDLVLGESWSGSKEPEDHEFWNRSPKNGPICIQAGLEGVFGYQNYEVTKISWRCNQKRNPEYKVTQSNGERYVSSAIKDQCMVIVIGADRSLSYELSYKNKWTLLSKLMNRFHSRLIDNEERVKKLKDKFAEIKEIFEEVSEFANFQTELRNQFDNMLLGMSYQLGIDFSAYDPSAFFHSLKILPNEENQIRTIEELGTGQEQVLAIAFAHAYAKAFFGGIVLVIEEPEAHLHPLAQIWLGKRIREMTADGLQVVITTHSPAFVDILGLTGITLIRKEMGATKIKQITVSDLVSFCNAHGARANETSILPFYSSNATQEILSGFFAKKIILVEGTTEYLALPTYFKKVGLDVEQNGIAIIPVMGKGNLAKWWRFFSAFGIPVYIIFDNDSGKDGNGSKRKDILGTLGVVDAETVQSYINSQDWLIHDTFSVFGTDFETILREHFTLYRVLEEQAKAEVGTTKPLVARYVANCMEENDGSEGWLKLHELRDKVERLGSSTSDKSELDERCLDLDNIDNIPF